MALDLRKLSEEQARIDRKVLEYSVQLLRPYYEKRRPVLRDINRFWATVVCETEPLRPYILFEDSLAFDELVDLYVDYDHADSRNFELTLVFNDNPHFSAQTLKKKFIWHEGTKDESSTEENTDKPNDDDEKDTGYYISPEPTKINWKSAENLGNAHENGGEESFFTWFGYTTTDNEEDRTENTAIAQLIIDEIFPNAIDLYKSAQDDQDIAEEYDISDD